MHIGQHELVGLLRGCARAPCVILLAGLLVGVLTPPRRLADASTYVLMTDSLWSDGDLAYTAADLARAQAMQFEDLPAGLLLSKHSWGYAYAKPLLYPLLAVPFYALLGVRGFLALNGLLLAALVVIGADILSHRLASRHAMPAAAVVFGFSVTPAYLSWIDPFLLGSLLCCGAVAAFRRGRVGWSAVLLVALASLRPPYALLALAPIALCLASRRWRDMVCFAFAGLAAAIVLLGIGRAAGGQWSPYGGERYSYASAFPYQVSIDEPELGTPAGVDSASWHWIGMADSARTNLYFLVGRFAGVLVYFPTLLACALWCRRWDREKVLWLLALALCCEAIVVLQPHNLMGGKHALGNRFFVLLPVALLFVDFVGARAWRLLGTALLALVAMPLVEAPVFYSIFPGRQMLEIPYRYLPLEWSDAQRIMFPFEFPGMAALTANQYGWEGDGVWTRGGTTAEFVFVRRSDDAPRLRLWSFLPSARVADGGTPALLSWRPSADMELVLSHPVVTYSDESHFGTEFAVYTLTIATDSGTFAYTVGDRHDSRYVGVFVRPSPVAPSP